MADYGNRFFRAQRLTGSNHVLKQRSASGRMENFRQAGIEPSALSGGKYEDSNIFVCHRPALSRERDGFDNDRVGREERTEG